MNGAYLSKEKVIKNQWPNYTKFSSKEDPSSEFPWPAKNYVCSFCKREFKSAQALGGHMNVHRRDRARLRLLPAWQPEKPYSFPNPNPNFSPPSNFFTPTYRPNNSLSLSSPPSLSSEAELKQKNRIVDLELKMSPFEDSEGDLDLELRL